LFLQEQSEGEGFFLRSQKHEKQEASKASATIVQKEKRSGNQRGNHKGNQRKGTGDGVVGVA